MKGKVEELMHPLFEEIKIIVEGTSIGISPKAKKTYLREVQNVKISRRPPKVTREDEPAIIFTNEDAR